jgi:hypothetical protein
METGSGDFLLYKLNYELRIRNYELGITNEAKCFQLGK